MPETMPCPHLLLSLCLYSLLSTLLGKVNFGKKKQGQDWVGVPRFFSRVEEMPPILGPLGDSCIRLRLRKGHGGESSHCVPPESGGRAPLSQDTLLCPAAPTLSQETLSWGGGGGLALCLAL